jgi:hypothetical protein
MGISNVVTLNITRSAPAVSRQGFGVAMILGSTITTAWSTDRIRSYTSPAAMLTDGFTTSSPEYKHALALFGQTNQPTLFKVGRRLTQVAQVDTVTPNVTTQQVTVYTVTINSTAYAFTSDSTPTAAEQVTGLTALINGDSNCPVTASGTNTLILTANVAGVPFTTTLGPLLTIVHTTADVGIQEDLNTIAGIDDNWYALDTSSTSDAEALLASAWVESWTSRKIFIYATNDSAIIAAGSSDLASQIMALERARSFIIWSGDYSDGAACALLGNILPTQPGSVTAKFKTLRGITPDALSGTAYTTAKAKNCNVYTTVAGVGMLEEGVVSDGEFLDVIIGVDWLYINMQADVFQVFLDNGKIPYTDAGASQIESPIRTRMKLAEKALIIAPGTTLVNVPLVATQSSGSKAARAMPGITFSGELAGAVHSVSINGNVYV